MKHYVLEVFLKIPTLPTLFFFSPDVSASQTVPSNAAAEEPPASSAQKGEQAEDMDLDDQAFLQVGLFHFD